MTISKTTSNITAKTTQAAAISTALLLSACGGNSAESTNFQYGVATTDALKTATYIPMQAKNSNSQAFSEFLNVGAGLVNKTEPNTTLWYALEGENGAQGIFDVFPHEQGRAEHFSGQVAAALNQNADQLVAGGWEQGVLNNVNHYEVLSAKIPSTPGINATEATYIEIQAKPGKEADLRALLTKAASIVADTEPKTVYWTGLQLNESTFAIFDTFTDASGRAEHFSGKVAMTLKGMADELVVGGWDLGVVANVQNYRIVGESNRLF